MHSSPAPTAPLETYAATRQLLAALLQFWPHAPHEASPSVLLCGPSGNGKSFLIQQAVAAASASAASNKTATSELRIVSVAPSLAPALVTRLKDGSTGLRRYVRSAVVDAIKASTDGSGGNSSDVDFAALIVLDHLECFADADGEACVSRGIGEGKGGAGADDGDDNEGPGAGVSARHPAFLTDLYTVLKSAPPLFTEEEAGAVKLRRLLFVSVFSGELEEVHPFLREFVFDEVVSLPTPTQASRETFFASHVGQAVTSLLERRVKKHHYAAHLAKALALRTGGISYRGLTEVVKLLLAESEEGAALLGSASTFSDTEESLCEEEEEEVKAVAAAVAHRVVSRFQSSASMAALDYRSSAGYVDVQHTRWSDIAGMATTKKALQDVLTRPLTHMALYTKAGVLPSKGILLYGPPGTGKTMVAKAVATELNASFIYLDLPSLVQCEVGESERKLNAFFAVARERSPTVMFVDELQAAFGLRYSTSANGFHKNATNSSAHDARLVSHLLQLLDAAQADVEHVIVFIGATNVKEMLDPLLLRAGRLDTHIEVGLPTRDARGSLAKRIVHGDWAEWWWRPSARDGHSDGDLRAKEAAQLQEALVSAFVEQSEGFSGAELRNATSVFALKLMQKVAAATCSSSVSNVAAAVGKQMPFTSSTDQHGIGRVEEWSAAIYHLLWSEEETLSSVGTTLVRESFLRGKAAL